MAIYFFVASSKLSAQLYPRLPGKKIDGLEEEFRRFCSNVHPYAPTIDTTRSSLHSASWKLWKADSIDFDNLPGPNRILASVFDHPFSFKRNLHNSLSLSLVGNDE